MTPELRPTEPVLSSTQPSNSVLGVSQLDIESMLNVK